MRKILLAISVLALTFAVSCNNGDDKPNNNDNPQTDTGVLKEGIYQPSVKIASVSEDGTVEEEWTWVNNNLDNIVMDKSDMPYTVAFSYAGGLLSKVTHNIDGGEEYRYTYSNNLFQSCATYENGNLGMTMNLSHNAAGKISSADIVIEDSYLMDGFGDLMKKAPHRRLVGNATKKGLSMMTMLQRNNGDKFSFGNRSVTLTLQWDGDNVAKAITNANFTLNVTADDLELLQMIGVEIPEQYMSLITTAIAIGGGTLPLQLTMGDTLSYAYDSHHNPYYCYWGNGIAAEVLSKNNVLSTIDNGAVKISANLLGQSIDLMNQPMNDESHCTYEYNSLGYPTSVYDGYSTYIYTYQQ